MRQKVVAHEGKIGCVASGERAVNTTVVCCKSAAGQYVPLMIIFQRKRYQEELAVGAPPGSIVTISDSGYINSELFVKWLRHFINFIEPSTVVVAGWTLEALELARNNGIRLLQLPSHTSHRLQPLDVGFFIFPNI
ncbi:hypothetical protein JTB14_029101 [Gonioctena quinquepunctata]|nr:hypothetical protein JTB14_029101 [Gonioctena quinquepunctata]